MVRAATQAHKVPNPVAKSSRLLLVVLQFFRISSSSSLPYLASAAFRAIPLRDFSDSIG
jgi:hypothetical protein